MKVFIRYMAVSFALIFLQGCLKGHEKSITVKVGLTHSKSHSFSLALARFADQVERETQGRYQVKIFHSSQLGGEKEMQEMLAIGSLDISVSGILNTYEPLFAVFEMPYLYRDRAHVLRVNKSEIMNEVAGSLTAKGIRLFGFYENGYRHISTSGQPVHSPDDLKGLLIRTPENPAQIETIRALGAIPTPMSFSELYTALLQGVVDGQENPLQNIWFGRLYEAQPFIAKTYHIYNSVYLITGTRFWNTLSAADKEIFQRAMHSSSEWQLQYMENLDKELEEKMKDEGVTFTYPDIQEFERAAQPAYDAMYESLGPGVKQMVQKIKAVE